MIFGNRAPVAVLPNTKLIDCRMISVKVLVALTPEASVIVTLQLNVPAAVGVPTMLIVLPVTTADRPIAARPVVAVTACGRVPSETVMVIVPAGSARPRVQILVLRLPMLGGS